MIPLPLVTCLFFVVCNTKLLHAEYERSEKMTIIDFISSLGGLFGLFLGFSLMSFVEIIYWFGVVMVRRTLLRK